MTSLFLKGDRVTSFFQEWNALVESQTEDAANKNIDVIIVNSGVHRAEPNKNERSVALLAHILPNKGVYVPNVVAAFKRGATPEAGQVLIVTGSGTSITSPVKEEGVPAASCTVVHADNVEKCQELQDFLSGGCSIGTTLKELPLQTGDFADSAKALLTAKNAVEASVVIGQCLRVKDAAARASVQKAGVLLTRILGRHIIPTLDTLPVTPKDFKDGKHMTKQKFTMDMSWLCNNANKVEGLEGLKDKEQFKQSLMFVGQSTGNYNTSMKVSPAAGGAEPLTGDCVIVSGGASHDGYTAFCARTFVFPDRCGEDIVAQYSYCYSLHCKLVELAQPGASYSAVSEQLIAFAKETNATLAERLDTSDFGCNTGLTILAGKEYINASNTTSVFKTDSAVVLRVALTNLAATAVLPKKEAGGVKKEEEVKKEGAVKEEEKNEEDLTKPVITTNAIHIADTFIIDLLNTKTQVRSNTSMTKTGNKPEDCILRVEVLVADPEDEDDDDDESEVEYIKPVTRQQTNTITGVSNEVRRNALIKEVLAERHAAWTATGGKSNTGGEEEDITGTELGKVVHGDFGPYMAVHPALHVDSKNKLVYLPIAGKVVPFHVAAISKADVKSLGTIHTLTVTFLAAVETNVAFRMHRTKVFLKEAVINSGDMEGLRLCQSRLTELIGAIKTLDVQRKATHGVAKGGQLQINRRGNLPKLARVKCKPPVIAGRNGNIGDLEAHDNGFRFTFIGGEPLQILYDNIKHCIFQPANNDPCTVFHLTLKQPILVGKKKCDEIQFAAEVVDQGENVSSRNKSDEEELEEEEREQKRIMVTNGEFAQFCKKLDGANKVVTDWSLPIAVPMKGFHFTGNTGRAMVKFKANKDILFALNEFPYWTQNFREVEVISLERVFPGMQNFDMKFIHKGYRKTTEVTNIPANHIEEIKNMLSIARTLFFESGTPLNWTQLLKVIRDDPDWEPYGPSGWATYITEGEDDEDEGGEGSDSDGSSDDDESDSDDSDSEDSSWAEEVSSEADSTASDDDDSESWDANERKAEEADRRRGRGGDDDDDDAPKKKKARTESHPSHNRSAGGGGGGGGGGAPRGAPMYKGAQIKGAPKAPMGVKRPGMPQPRMPPPAAGRR